MNADTKHVPAILLDAICATTELAGALGDPDNELISAITKWHLAIAAAKTAVPDVATITDTPGQPLPERWTVVVMEELSRLRGLLYWLDPAEEDPVALDGALYGVRNDAEHLNHELREGADRLAARMHLLTTMLAVAPTYQTR
jgi:hypothetical protein